MTGQDDIIWVDPPKKYPGSFSYLVSGGDADVPVEFPDASVSGGEPGTQYTAVSVEGFAEYAQSVRSGFCAVCLLLGIITGILLVGCFWHGRMR